MPDLPTVDRIAIAALATRERLERPAPADLAQSCRAARAMLGDAAALAEIAYEHKGPVRPTRLSMGIRAVYACVRCHNLLSGKAARCSKCGHSHSIHDPAEAIR